MSTLTEIGEAVENLPQNEFWKFADWFDQVKARAWDEQMATDAASGKMDFLFGEAEAERSEGRLVDWPPES